MVQLHITMTGKGYNPRDEWSMLGTKRKNFIDIAGAREWIRENYGKSKRSSMYIDLPNGDVKKIGYVIGFRNADISHYPIDKWLQQDWIEFISLGRDYNL